MRVSIPQPKAVLFDFDGVLAESEGLHLISWQKLFAELGIDLDAPELEAYLGYPAPETIQRILADFQPTLSADRVYIDLLVKRKTAIYLESAKLHLRAYPGVREGLIGLRGSGVRIAVVSNAPRHLLYQAIQISGLDGLFHLVLSRNDVEKTKPHPLPYLRAAALLGISPDDCIVVEDSTVGLTAALLGGFRTVALQTTTDLAKLRAPVSGRSDLSPDWICGSPAEFFSMLTRSAGSQIHFAS